MTNPDDCRKKLAMLSMEHNCIVTGNVEWDEQGGTATLEYTEID